MVFTIKKKNFPYRNFIDRSENFKIKSPEKTKIQSSSKIHNYGKWYSIKHHWVKFWADIESDEDEDKDEYEIKTHLYELKLKQTSLTNLKNPDFNKILVLKTKKDLVSFGKKYGVNKPNNDTDIFFLKLNWNKIVKDFGGIEITVSQTSNIRRHPDTSWYSDWDIPSGCIWNTTLVKEINKIK